MCLHEPLCTAEDFFPIHNHAGAAARRFRKITDPGFVNRSKSLND